MNWISDIIGNNILKKIFNFFRSNNKIETTIQTGSGNIKGNNNTVYNIEKNKENRVDEKLKTIKYHYSNNYLTLIRTYINQVHKNLEKLYCDTLFFYKDNKLDENKLNNSLDSTKEKINQLADFYFVNRFIVSNSELDQSISNLIDLFKKTKHNLNLINFLYASDNLNNNNSINRTDYWEKSYLPNFNKNIDKVNNISSNTNEVNNFLK